tara:strand:- start:569 stop:1909 length:1341 start_codon:yes stop_codon:yes gene_type:complete
MKITIIGVGEVGFNLAKGLSEENFDITAIDNNPMKCERAREYLDVFVVEGDGASPTVLKEAKVGESDIVVTVTRVDEVNLIACQLVHELGARKIISRLRNTEYSKKDTIIHPEKFGIDLVIHPEMAASEEIVRLVKQTSATSVMDFEGGRLQVVGIRLENGTPISNKLLKDIREEYNHFSFCAVAVLRNQETIIPHGDFTFQGDDLCYFLAKRDSVNHVLEMVGKPINETRNALIVGGGKIGRTVANKLSSEIDVRLVDNNKEKARKLATRLDKTLILNGDGTSIEFLKSENIDELDSFIAVTESEKTNILSALLAKHLGSKQTIVHVSTTDYIPATKVIGLDAVVSKNMSTVNIIHEYIKSGDHVSVKNFEDIPVEAVEITPVVGSEITKTKLREVDLPSACIIGAVNHHGNLFIPKGDSSITDEDSVLLFTIPQVIPKVEKLFI